MLPLPRVPARRTGSDGEPVLFGSQGWGGQEASCLSQNLLCGFTNDPSPLPSSLNVCKGFVCLLGVLGAAFSLAGPALAPSLEMRV